MPKSFPLVRRALAAAVCVAALAPAWADEATIRKTIAERMPQFPAIDEVSKTPIPGLFEVRIGTDLFYSDAQGNFLIEGEMIDTRTRENLTQARVAKLTAIDFASLPLKDAIVFKQGTGARRLAVFADPNCGYCKKFERDLAQLKDVTVYTFLYPILGGDSPEKARNIWCAQDSTKVWRDWMVEGVPPPRAMGQCDTGALTRNAALGRKHKVSGTPSLVFEDGKRVPGAVPPDQIEKMLAAASRKPG
jgi:thiol:disulfide interchange protein DsbC